MPKDEILHESKLLVKALVWHEFQPKVRPRDMPLSFHVLDKDGFDDWSEIEDECGEDTEEQCEFVEVDVTKCVSRIFPSSAAQNGPLDDLSEGFRRALEIIASRVSAKHINSSDKEELPVSPAQLVSITQPFLAGLLNNFHAELPAKARHSDQKRKHFTKVTPNMLLAALERYGLPSSFIEKTRAYQKTLEQAGVPLRSQAFQIHIPDYADCEPSERLRRRGRPRKYPKGERQVKKRQGFRKSKADNLTSAKEKDTLSRPQASGETLSRSVQPVPSQNVQPMPLQATPETPSKQSKSKWHGKKQETPSQAPPLVPSQTLEPSSLRGVQPTTSQAVEEASLQAVQRTPRRGRSRSMQVQETLLPRHKCSPNKPGRQSKRPPSQRTPESPPGKIAAVKKRRT